jgi:TPR repeat protein
MLRVETSSLAKQGLVQKIFARVVNWFREEYRLTHYAHTRWRAENGDPRAQFNLAIMCESGNGIFQTSTEATKWYQKAAFQGIAEAQLALGLKFLIGEGINQSDSEALLWLRKAAEQGQAEAQYHLGNLFRDGRGTTRDLVQASKWYRKAADRGHAEGKKCFKELNTANFGSQQIISLPEQQAA